jgi:MFS transporter, ACS family, hexuronate transporter
MSGWAMLALVTLAHALGALSVLSVAPLAPFLLESLQLTRAQVGLFVPAVYLGGVLMALPAGWLTDRLGVRATLALGQLVIGSGVLLASAAGGLGSCLAALVLAGFGFSVLNPSTGKAVVEWFPPRRRGVAMGIKQTGLTLGGLTGALTLPPLALTHGWRFALAAAAVLSLVSAILVTLV